jgi:AraC family transcriptional regulator
MPAAADLDRIMSGVAPAVHLFLRDFEAKREKLGHARPSARTQVLQRLERARSWIHANSHRPVTLHEVGREAAMSPFHLTRTFSEVFGRAPLNYHRSLRLREAAAELEAGRASPSELSRSLGYTCLSSFTRAFSAEFGVPPSRMMRRGSAQNRNFG